MSRWGMSQTLTLTQALRKICVDDAPQNPDELIVQCSNSECRKWMHVRCIAEKAVQRAGTYHGNLCGVRLSDFHIPVDEQAGPKRSSKAQKKKGKLKNANYSNLTAMALASKGSMTAEVLIKGHPDRSKAEPAKDYEIVITTKDEEQYSEEVCCLFCGAEVE
jgi:hypothetical protein